MERYEHSQSYCEEGKPSPPLQPKPVPPTSPLVPATCTILKQSTSSTTGTTSTQSHHPLMQYQESASTNLTMSISKVPSNLERVITTSKMASLQARRGSGSSLTNLRNSLLADDNPRRGSAIGQCRTAHTWYKVAL